MKLSIHQLTPELIKDIQRSLFSDIDKPKPLKFNRSGL
ncbi:MAG TPA: hypothetical protein DCQ51_03360 [Planktothrix sp. UBA8407]|nr:hypothetical protein [Planktothrix sp. UBA8402]HAO10227.1 hypothetical protein [Planktothrix sp. UBA8407]HBK21725.1 hypothetical protein [Planktothrix sp. UBA10369]